MIVGYVCSPLLCHTVGVDTHFIRGSNILRTWGIDLDETVDMLRHIVFPFYGLDQGGHTYGPDADLFFLFQEVHFPGDDIVSTFVARFTADGLGRPHLLSH